MISTVHNNSRGWLDRNSESPYSDKVVIPNVSYSERSLCPDRSLVVKGRYLSKGRYSEGLLFRKIANPKSR